MTADPAAERIDEHLGAVDAAADWQPEPGDDDDPAGPVYGNWGPETVPVMVTFPLTWKDGSELTDKPCPECNGKLFHQADAPYPYWCGCGGVFTESELVTGIITPF